jgi:hypothetical protein
VLVIDTSQVMADIPYGDYFRVESRWEVSPAVPVVVKNRDGTFETFSRVTAWVGLRIPFHRNTMLRKVIEQGASEESRKSVANVLGSMRAKLRIAAAAAAVAEATAAAAEAAVAAAGGGEDSTAGAIWDSPPSPREALDRLSGEIGAALRRASGDGVSLGGLDGEDNVDVSKLNIPDCSKDVIWRMLFGGGATRKVGSGGVSPRGSGGGGFGPSPSTSPRAAPASSLGRGSGDRRSSNNPGDVNAHASQFSPQHWINGGGGGPGGGGGGGRGGGGGIAHHDNYDYSSPHSDYNHGGGGYLRSFVGGFFGSGGLLGGGFVVVAFVVAAGALILAVQAAWLTTMTLGWRGWSWGDGADNLGVSAGGDVAFWQRRVALLGVELRTSERRLAFVAAEVAHAQGALKEAAGRLTGTVANRAYPT